MKTFLTTLIALTIMVAPTTAGAAIVHAEAGAGARNHMFLWSLDYNTTTDDLVVNATHTKFDGSPAIGQPQEASIVLIRPNGTERVFNLLTIRNPVDNQFNILNDGPLTFANIATRVTADRAALIEFRTDYTPPVGA